MEESAKKTDQESTVKRCFAAISLPQLQQAILKQLLPKLKQLLPEAKWVSAHNIHLTLHFFGEIPPRRLQEAMEILNRVVPSFNSFDLFTSQLGRFPAEGLPRVIWLGVKEKQNHQLIELQRCLCRQLEIKGFAVESRPFQPHLTLARVKSRLRSFSWDLMERAFSQVALEKPKIFDRVSTVQLYESLLTNHGPEYRILATFSLG